MTDVNKITPGMIEGQIVGEAYVRGHEASEKFLTGQYAELSESRLACLTICLLVLKNGFIVVGESSCVDTANFDADLGRKYAREQAVEKIWPLMGYQLKSRLAGVNGLT